MQHPTNASRKYHLHHIQLFIMMIQAYSSLEAKVLILNRQSILSGSWQKELVGWILSQ